MSSLESIIDIKSGRIADKSGTKYPIYGGNGIIGYSDNFNFEDIIIIGRVGANCGSVHYEKGKCWVSDNALAGVPKNENSKFNYYLLKLFKLNSKQIGSSQPLLTQGILNNLNINFPSKKLTQQKIASILSALDDKIELNNKIITELEAMAKIIYDYWFVQFDFPTPSPSGRAGVGQPYKSSGGKMVWNEHLKRKVPEGWEVNRIGDLLKTSLGGTPSTKVKEYWNGSINWLNSGEIANFPILDSELKITDKAIKNSATELLPKGSVLLSITRHLRPTVLAIDACANQSVVGIKEHGNIKYYFLYPYLKNEIPRLMSLRTGAQQPHINKETVDDSLIIIPNAASNVLQQYNSKVEPCYKAIMNNSFQNQQLSQLRDWLLPMLMNGQVTVGQAYEEMAEVLSVAAEDGGTADNT